jgi:predicted nucleic acid-binding protein
VTFILDASVALAWLLRDASERGEAYARHLLKSFRKPGLMSIVPGIWGLEIANVVSRSETKGLVSQAQSDAYLAMLQSLPIAVDSDTAVRALADTLQLARRYKLSSYDASYLELALRQSLPLATLDEDLRHAMSKSGVRLFDPE